MTGGLRPESAERSAVAVPHAPDLDDLLDGDDPTAGVSTIDRSSPHVEGVRSRRAATSEASSTDAPGR